MLIKQKWQGIISAMVMVIIVASMLVLPVLASSDEGMVFTVTPQKAANQASEAGYFDLKVSPGDSQTLEVLVKNSSSEEITLEVGAVSASTAPSGVVDYTSTVEEDETLVHSFSEIATVREPRTQVPANSEKMIYIDFKIPTEEFDGILLGGIRTTDITARLKREKIETSDEDAGIAIFNEYEFVVGVKIQENDNKVEPNFELTNVEVGLSNYEAAIITSIRNLQPLLVKDAKLSGGIYPKGASENIFSIDGLAVNFAPNSVMKYEFVDRAGYGLDAGDYTFRGKLEYEGKTWEFEDDFTIEQAEAAQVNEGAIGQQAQRNNLGLPLWLIIVIVALAMLILILLVVLLIKLTKKRK